MEFLRGLPLPKRLTARVWLFTLPSALFSFERRQNVPGMPIGRARLLGLLVLGAGLGMLFRGRQPTALSPNGRLRLGRFQERPMVTGGLLALGGAGVLLRSMMLTAYAAGLAFAFARRTVELEEPNVPGQRDAIPVWELEQTEV